MSIHQSKYSFRKREFACIGIALLLSTTLSCEKEIPSSPTPNADGPEIVSRIPEDQATDVARNSVISVTFDKEMESSTLTRSTFRADEGNGAVAATVSYEEDARTVTLSPSSPFSSSATVTITLKSTVADSDGNSQGADVTWTFTCSEIVDTEAPTFAGIATATDNGNGTAHVTWAAASDNTTPASSILYKIYKSPNFTSPIQSVTGATSTNLSQVTEGSYTYRVRARDSAGNEDTNSVDEDVSVTYSNVSFTDDIYPLIGGTCTSSSCHDNVNPQPGPFGFPPGMNLSTRDLAYSNTVEVDSSEKPGFKRIKASDSANSYLYEKLSDPTPFEGLQMPRVGTKFNSLKLELIRNWIDNGALDN